MKKTIRYKIFMTLAAIGIFVSGMLLGHALAMKEANEHIEYYKKFYHQRLNIINPRDFPRPSRLDSYRQP